MHKESISLYWYAFEFGDIIMVSHMIVICDKDNQSPTKIL